MASLRTLLLAGIACTTLAASLAVPQQVAAQTQVASATAPTRIIGEREISRRIADMVKQRNGGRPVEIMFHGMGNELEVPASAAAFQVDDFSYDSRSGRFYGTVASAAASIKVSGRAQTVEAIPVLKSRIAAGHVISRSDVEWLQVPANRYGAGYVDRFDDLIGQTPRRALAAGMPIRTNDIGKPEAIARNSLVTMMAQGPGITITTTGRAMESGSIGDVVQVMNLQSKRTIQATVTGMNLVQVITAPNIIASN
ncbi:flagellar basal body P-ring formation chaperone FlgA [Ferrovibrio sp.]|uniref:flagellar basal body P-ring formation chaperone FlgA n=1 Tax=Ferrovibrio sp. TaxID=1917215 RepID=UPI000CAEE69A|nr:flagellar basal body P-ring formation chaperone FlgA [Ferrovibrio sp.]PJI43453.1 MAG: flagella basal body P-ring formation protein FlgA [Ferrovibrio sp.]